MLCEIEDIKSYVKNNSYLYNNIHCSSSSSSSSISSSNNSFLKIAGIIQL